MVYIVCLPEIKTKDLTPMLLVASPKCCWQVSDIFPGAPSVPQPGIWKYLMPVASTDSVSTWLRTSKYPNILSGRHTNLELILACMRQFQLLKKALTRLDYFYVSAILSSS